jgi:tetratricopeptide (TPR) repeat protein
MDLQGPVFTELSNVRQVGLALLDSPKHVDLGTRLLEEAAKTLTGYTPTLTKGAAITLLLETEIPKVKTPGNSNLLAILFGLPENLTGLHPRELRTKAAKAAGETRENFARTGRKEDQTLQSLAAQIVADCLNSGIAGSRSRPGAANGAASAKPRYSNPLYIHRPQLHEAYSDLAHSDAKVIVLYGFPGMGKTWLVRSIVKLADGSAAPVIRVHEGRPYLPDVQQAIAAYPIDTSRLIAAEPEAYLTLLLSDESGPDRVVLDGLETADELTDFLPASPTSSVVVATCRAKGNFPPDDCQFIRVDKMSSDESIEMVRRFLPQLSGEDAAYLAKTVNGYPIVLRYACALLANSSSIVRDFCQELLTDAQSIAGRTPTPGNDTLLIVLIRLTEAIKKRNSDAYDLLIVTCFVGDILQEGAYRPVLEKYLAIIRDLTSASVRCADAIQVLIDMAIIDTRPDDYIVLHSLTRRTLRAYFRDRIRDVGEATAVLDAQYGENSQKWSKDDYFVLHKEETYAAWHCMEIYCAWLIEMNNSPEAIPHPRLQAYVADRLAVIVLSTNEIILKKFGVKLPEMWIDFARRTRPDVYFLLTQMQVSEQEDEGNDEVADDSHADDSHLQGNSETASQDHYLLYREVGSRLHSMLTSWGDPQRRAAGQADARAHFGDLYKALTHALETGQSINGIVDALDEYLDQIQQHKMRSVLLETAIACLPTPSSREQQEELAKLHDCAGGAAIQQHHFDDARRHYETELQLDQAMDDRRAQGVDYHQLGMVAEEQRNFDEAKINYRKALEIRKEFDDQHGIASTYEGIGRLADKKHELTEAESNFRKALGLFVELGDKRRVAGVYHGLGQVATRDQRFAEAEENYRKALSVFQEIGDRHHAATCYHSLGVVAEEQQNFPEAKANYQKSLDIKLELDDRLGAAATYNQLGMIARAERRYAEAKANYRNALEIFWSADDEYSAGLVHHNLGDLALDDGQPKEALASYGEALRIFEKFGDEEKTADTYETIIKMRQGDNE